MFRYLINIPEPSSKRLVDKRLIVHYNTGFTSSKKEFILNDEKQFEIYSALDVKDNVMDGENIIAFVEFSNSTGTRVEKIEVKVLKEKE